MPSLADVTLGFSHCVTYGEDIDLTKPSVLRDRECTLHPFIVFPPPRKDIMHFLS